MLKKNSWNLRLKSSIRGESCTMNLKKILIAVLLSSATIAYAGSKVPPAAPAPAQQNLPADKHPDPAKPENAPELPPSPVAPGHDMQGPAPLPSSHEMTDSYEGAFVRMLVTLLGLVFLVFATFWILRRLGKGKFKMGSGRTINVIERRAVSPKTMLYVVEIGNKKILISESQLEVRALTTYEELPENNE